MKTIISASRRTDIPGFYMRWFEYHLRQGWVDVVNPVIRSTTFRVDLRPETVHTLVLWSKNYRPFLQSATARDPRYRFYFNVSLVDCPAWEQNLPPLGERLQQVTELCQRWSPRHINWRFDPILFWEDGRRTNLDSFRPIADHVASLGVERCTFSFVTWYRKVHQRPEARPLRGYDPPLTQKHDILHHLAEMARERGLTLESCCDDALLEVDGVTRGACIPGERLRDLAGEPCTRSSDSSQRNDCGCTRSRDIGAYAMTCPHGCAYCYASPSFPSSAVSSSGGTPPSSD